MCYLIAKNNQGGSSLAIQMMHGKELAKLKQKLLSDLPGEEIQLLTVCLLYTSGGNGNLRGNDHPADTDRSCGICCIRV